jgi:hypothetical protein
VVRDAWAAAQNVRDPAASEDDAKSAIQRFVTDFDQGLIHAANSGVYANVITIAHLLRRVVAIDNKKPSNRKGDIPRALGLAYRGKPHDATRDRAIFIAIDRLLDQAVRDDPNRPLKITIAAVYIADALNAEALTVGLTSPAVEKVYYDWKVENGTSYVHDI